MKLRLVAKADLGLGRMNIYVHERRIDLDEDECDGMPVAHKHVTARTIERVRERRVLDRTAVDEKVLICFVRPARAGTADETVDMNTVPAAGEIDQVSGYLFAVELERPFPDA